MFLVLRTGTTAEASSRDTKHPGAGAVPSSANSAGESRLSEFQWCVEGVVVMFVEGGGGAPDLRDPGRTFWEGVQSGEVHHQMSRFPGTQTH